MTSPLEVIIVGGGTAGWMAANLMAKKWGKGIANITLIESPDIPIVGVGEGSTPYLKKLFDTLDIAEKDWMPKCNATYKNGILFNQWSTMVGHQQYFHPFASELDQQNLLDFEQSTRQKRNGHDVIAHPDKYFFMTALTKQAKLAKPPINFPYENLYGYHFDSHLLGGFLKSHAVNLSVTHIQAKVEAVIQHTTGDISSVKLDNGDEVFGDLFIDCTGFRALLIEKTLKVPFHSYSNELLNDSAVAIPSNKHSVEMPQTVSTAFSNGWAWRIPLTNRIGNGYVYSSKHQSSSSAEAELRSKLKANVHDVEAKHLKMKIGRLEKHWFKNCLAVGLSQGFIEPLEATALHLVQNTIEQFIELFEKGNFTLHEQDFFNAQTNFGFDRIKDYIVLHYLTSSRKDTQYWQDVRNTSNLSESLKRILNVWFDGGDLRTELENQNIHNYYSSMSWHVMFAGNGVYPTVNNSSLSLKNAEKLKKININNKNSINKFNFIST